MNDAQRGLKGRWKSVLITEGIKEDLLDGKQHPCPICGGHDRFRFDDKDEGLWYCNHCGSGDGYTLLMGKFGYDFKTAKGVVTATAKLVEPERSKPVMSDHRKRELMNQAWNNAVPYAAGLGAYLSSRAIPSNLHFNPSIRWHPALYCSAVKQQGAAILIKCYRWSINGKPEPATIQRHWPELNLKMMMPAPIKLDGIFCPLGGRPVKGILGITEGYITALSVMAMASESDRTPVWPCMSAEQLIKFTPPPEVHTLRIFTDVDKSFTGQAAAYALAKRLRISHPHLETVVCYPTLQQNIDFDFNDALQDMKWSPLSNSTAPGVDAATDTASPA